MIFTFSFCPLDVKFAPLVSLAHRYVSTKLEVSTAFVHGADGQTEEVQRLMRRPGRIIKIYTLTTARTCSEDYAKVGRYV